MTTDPTMKRLHRALSRGDAAGTVAAGQRMGVEVAPYPAVVEPGTDTTAWGVVVRIERPPA
ncbi:MAG: hypothetical protein RLZZ373_2837 [Pseudomonadota bacterium]|jgi:hypothetical protein